MYMLSKEGNCIVDYTSSIYKNQLLFLLVFEYLSSDILTGRSGFTTPKFLSTNTYLTSDIPIGRSSLRLPSFLFVDY